MNNVDVLVIGAGAAGLMCAIEAGKRGKNVLVLDHANKAGKKILMSGGGRCNFTNLDVSDKNFISNNPHFCKSALSRYTPQDFIALVKEHDIPFHEKTLGQLFCDNKSKDILNMLLKECEAGSVIIELDTTVEVISQESSGQFIVKTAQEGFVCQSLVIASGGLSIPTMGASPFGYKIAAQFGIDVLPTRAGLVPFTAHTQDKETLETLAGISLSCIASCHKKSFREGILFTHRGLSGPAILQLSSYWLPGETVTINFLPDHDLFKLLTVEKRQDQKITVRTFLNQHFPKRMVSAWLDTDVADKNLKTLSDHQLKIIANAFQAWEIKPNGTEGYRTAEVTLGGVNCDAISSKTFEASQVSGLYFIGEVLDVTGWLGGYNFQWAWASGFAAGQVV